MVKIEKLLAASPQKVWDALTEKDKMKEWYFDLSDFKAVVGFQFSFAGKGHKGQEYIHLCKVIEVIPFKKLVYSWQYEGIDGYSEVCFELLEEGEFTKVLLTHTGLESFPKNNPDFAKGSFTEGWTTLIQTFLPEYLNKIL